MTIPNIIINPHTNITIIKLYFKYLPSSSGYFLGLITTCNFILLCYRFFSPSSSSTSSTFRSITSVGSWTSICSFTFFSDLILSGFIILPGVGLYLLSDSEELIQVFLSFVVKEIIVILPIEN